jgi:Spy/CpxP family protein refolding chaperone
MLLRRSFAVLLLGCGVLGLVASDTMAGEAKPVATAAPATPPPAVDAAAAKPRAGGRRLPAYYKDVVTQEQREAIYQIQEEYGAKIAEVKARLADLQQQQAAKIAALLKPEQKQKIDQLRAAAAAKRQAKPAARP